MKSSGYAGDGTPEDGLVTGEPGQDGPLDIVLELDLEETEHALVAEDVTEDVTEVVTDDVTEPEAAEPTESSDVTEPTEADVRADADAVAAATAEPDRDDEPTTQDAAEPSAPEVAQVDPEPQAAPEPSQAPVDEDDTAYAAPVSSPPSRPRRHRGRVVAPAGPPRTVTAGGDANG
jgi:ribonuclease E